MNDDALLDRLEAAIGTDALRYCYQPKVSLSDGKLRRVEALIRWDDEVHGTIGPDRFIPLAEENGLIDSLTRWGLDTAFRQWREWTDQGIECELAFNISARSLEALDFPDLVEAKTAEYGVPASCLVLELTEGSTQTLINLMDTLTRFRIKGIGLAIDDFGTGYSTLKLLRMLPFTELKIDRFFVRDAERSMDSRVIVEAMIGLAHGLGLSATAEGIENDAQLSLMKALGCDLAQGYRIGRPLDAAALPDWQRDWMQEWETLRL
ncbi:EAL domain-containing protein [Sphingomicrobium marinum]|uniref:EAL domain-containing protein n=1 Tax=Sphingomicrobium marinum TaxID=1227950 RepID=UPI00223EEF58|nr:EAL domain-containing protein [Sphingomicrobium marinum]